MIPRQRGGQGGGVPHTILPHPMCPSSEADAFAPPAQVSQSLAPLTDLFIHMGLQGKGDTSISTGLLDPSLVRAVLEFSECSLRAYCGSQ